MTQIFDENGHVVPVSVIAVQPAKVSRVKLPKSDGYTAVVVGVAPSLRKTRDGEKEIFQKTREFRVDSVEGIEMGAVVDGSQFVEGERVKVTGTSIGKGFQGVVKRHGFHGSPKSHGHKDQLRMPGSLSASSFPSHVMKGKRMGGRMGGEKSTVRGLSIVKVDTENQQIYLSGAIPGKRNSWIYVQAQ